jgi:AbiV family abortive infection protein
MAQQRTPTVLTIEQLSEGYEKAISTAFRLLQASMELTQGFPEIALGLAEIGQEELGKSLSFLAAFHLSQEPEDWRWFWSGWTDHQLKAHRAFLYELIHPRRIEIHGSGGKVRAAGLPSRAKIQHEKESAFYVNFDAGSGRFIAPQDAVAFLENQNRVITLLYLAVTALHIENALRSENEAFRLHAFAEVAFRICSEELYQQDIPAILVEFGGRSSHHASLITALREQLAVSDQYMATIFKVKVGSE